MSLLKIALCFALFNLAQPAAIPIWHLLSRQEKVAELAYRFIYLVENHCENSNIPDCEDLYTLYGISTLIKLDDATLDQLEPYHRDSVDVLWKTLFNKASGDSQLSNEKKSFEDLNEVEYGHNSIDPVFSSDYLYSDYEDIDEDDANEPFPYAIKVAAPPSFSQQVNNIDTLDSDNHLESKFGQSTKKLSSSDIDSNIEIESQEVHTSSNSSPSEAAISSQNSQKSATTSIQDGILESVSNERESNKDGVTSSANVLKSTSEASVGLDRDSVNEIISRFPKKENKTKKLSNKATTDS